MNTISINLIVPQGWHELDDKQLRYVYSLIAKEFSADEIKTLALLHFSGCKVIARHDKNSFLLKHEKNLFQTSGTIIAEVIPSLGWLDAIPASPVRLKKLRNHASVDAEFQGVPFETYIVVENLYQGFLSTQKDALLDEIAHVLYPGCSATLTPEERISIFYWVASLNRPPPPPDERHDFGINSLRLAVANRFNCYEQPTAQGISGCATV